jgi:hypothetical protein
VLQDLLNRFCIPQQKMISFRPIRASTTGRQINRKRKAKNTGGISNKKRYLLDSFPKALPLKYASDEGGPIFSVRTPPQTQLKFPSSLVLQEQGSDEVDQQQIPDSFEILNFSPPDLEPSESPHEKVSETQSDWSSSEVEENATFLQKLNHALWKFIA